MATSIQRSPTTKQHRHSQKPSPVCRTHSGKAGKGDGRYQCSVVEKQQFKAELSTKFKFRRRLKNPTTNKDLTIYFQQADGKEFKITIPDYQGRASPMPNQADPGRLLRPGAPFCPEQLGWSKVTGAVVDTTTNRRSLRKQHKEGAKPFLITKGQTRNQKRKENRMNTYKRCDFH